MKKGFTLIELLVVVLSIGILAAALPQYQKAVYKTRLVRTVEVARAIREAEEAYYLANGSYLPNTLEGLDIDFTLKRDGEFLQTPDGFLDIMQGTSPRINIWFCPESPTYQECLKQRTVLVSVWFSQSEKPGEITCTGLTNFGTSLCKTLKW